MNGELLAALERLEKEKGISKSVLISAIESALTSAAVKIIGGHDVSKEDITVRVNSDTGGIEVYQGDERVKSDQFGRIAAQTAKQVMIQKIREAERDVISEKYLDMQGDIVNGAVHRFEKGNIIVELDDTEAILPKSEQIPRERFRQGETLRTLLLRVDKKSGGIDLVLSRSNEGFVKKLFELEVPEISQGIVEIMSVAREAGERTKIAVRSTDEKVDSVGACVGMRGSRVKEIVKELSGERIDIVRWSEDIKEYVKNAVSPVELYSMEIDQEERVIKLAVAKDQLALLIGKKGRNIRLASKLLGLELQAESLPGETDVPLTNVSGLEEDLVKTLQISGFKGASDVLERSIEELAGIEGVDEEKARELISACKEALEKVSKENDDTGDPVPAEDEDAQEVSDASDKEEAGEQVEKEPDSEDKEQG